MLSRRLLGATVALLALTGAAVGVARSARTTPPPSDPTGTTRAAAVPESTGSLLLTVAIDHRGVQVLQVTRKPTLEFRAPRHAAELDYRWRIRDAAGRSLAEGGFDPARICLDPAHAGQPPHLEGDLVVPHVAHVNVKVPDLRDAARFELERRDGGREVAFGTTPIDTLEIR